MKKKKIKVKNQADSEQGTDRNNYPFSKGTPEERSVKNKENAFKEPHQHGADRGNEHPYKSR